MNVTQYEDWRENSAREEAQQNVPTSQRHQDRLKAFFQCSGTVSQQILCLTLPWVRLKMMMMIRTFNQVKKSSENKLYDLSDITELTGYPGQVVQSSETKCLDNLGLGTQNNWINHMEYRCDIWINHTEYISDI